MYILGIETFLAVARSQSLSRAAEKLYLAQSTVSNRIKVLEKEIGITLIQRSKGSKQIQLTKSGEEFYKLAEQWINIWKEAMILKENGPKLSLVVGAVDSLNTFLLPQVFNDLNMHHPPITLTIRTSHSPELYDEVEKRQVDVAFVLREMIHPNVNVKKYFKAPMVLLRHAEASDDNYSNYENSREVHPSELDPMHELFFSWGPNFLAWHEQWWNPLTPPRIRLDSIQILLSLFKNPKQWAIVPLWIANAASKLGNYSIYRLSENPPDYTCYKLTHKQPISQITECLDIFEHYMQLALPNVVKESSI
jgi:DNA-binding transcriptional LysR family regulator